MDQSFQDVQDMRPQFLLDLHIGGKEVVLEADIAKRVDFRFFYVLGICKFQKLFIGFISFFQFYYVLVFACLFELLLDLLTWLDLP